MGTAAEKSFPETLGLQTEAPTGAMLLSDLRAAHSALTDCLEKLEGLVAEPGHAGAALSTARFMMSQASYARRQVFHKACAFCAARASSDELELIRSLQRDDFKYVHESTAHVQRWSAAAVVRDWPTYQQASRAMRSKLREAIRNEQKLLYPLLAQSLHR